MITNQCVRYEQRAERRKFKLAESKLFVVNNFQSFSITMQFVFGIVSAFLHSKFSLQNNYFNGEKNNET